ncbi:hypothetical protein BDZ89DRAFT_974089, partial [Hymenopellis radicata]
HYDFRNFGTGLCCIIAYGDFDIISGGQPILWDRYHIIQVPPESCIMLSSMLLLHFNEVGLSAHAGWNITQYFLDRLLCNPIAKEIITR